MSGDLSYRTRVGQWRAEREASLTAPDGWLSIVGLFFLKEGTSTLGSDPSCDIVLPHPAPAAAGRLERHHRRVVGRFPAGTATDVAGRAVLDIDLSLPREGPPPTVRIGPLTLNVHASGSRLGIRLRQDDSPLRSMFGGLSWFPVDAEYRVTARYTPLDAPTSIEIPNILGDSEPHVIPGTLSFTLQGQAGTLTPYRMETGQRHRLFIVFTDGTSGRETYGAARFVYADWPGDGETVVDFNMAYNPPCAFNPYTTCPLPPPQNRLPMRIEAGEKSPPTVRQDPDEAAPRST